MILGKRTIGQGHIAIMNMYAATYEIHKITTDKTLRETDYQLSSVILTTR